MADSPTPEIQIAVRLAEDLGSLSAGDIDWLRRVLEAFPVPTAREVPSLIWALERLVRVVPWASEVLKEEFLGPLGRLAPVIGQLPRRRSDVYGEWSVKELGKVLGGDFLLAGTIHGLDDGLGLSAGTEALRLVLLVCQWRWSQSEDPRVSCVQDLRSAIRGTERSAISPQLLFELGRATTLIELLDAASGLDDAGHVTLAAAWRNHIGPELSNAARPRPPRSKQGPEPRDEPGRGPTIPDPPADGGGQRAKTAADDEFIDRLQGRLRSGMPPRPTDAPVPLPGEDPQEVSPSLLTSPLSEAPANADAEGVARYQLQQAIWSTNYLLLPNHPDVLPYKDYARAVKGTLALLRDPATDKWLRYGGCGLLLQALLGRTPKTLTAFDVLENGKAEHDPRRLEFLIDEGVLRLSPFWQVPRGDFEPSYFRPTEQQRAYLEEVGGHFLLPLAPPILEALRANLEVLKYFAKAKVWNIEGWLREAAACVGETQGIRFTMGQLRASASTHLFDRCRDIAVVQLLCADTLGKPTSCLSYFAPRARRLAEIHWAFQEEALGIRSPLPAALLSDLRVGTHLLVREEVVETMVSSITANLVGGSKSATQKADPALLHRTMVLHLSAMFVALATHRPTEALFKLDLKDIWIDHDVGAALFRDKVCDAAHDPRLVALPATICRQIRAYLDHLLGLAECIPTIRPHVGAVLAGRKPLLFALDERGHPQELRLSEWKAALPPVWCELPANWGRHWVRTRGIELGIRPELVNIQMGHLEVVGYPFSGASPTEPRLFVEEMALRWEALARAQGWQVIRGLRTKGEVRSLMLTPLHPWSSRVHAHEASQRDIAKQWRTAMVARLRTYREEAEAVVLAHPDLKKAEIVKRFAATGTNLEPHALKRGDFERIRDELFDGAGDDLAMAIARANALCRVAATVNRRTRQESETPGRVVSLRRPLDNAFVPGMLEAVRQVDALREYVGTFVDNEIISGQLDMTAACARTVLAMVLFGYCEQPEQILGALQRRTKLQRSATLANTVLVPWGDEPHQVMALRGLAALTFARLAWKFRKEAVPDVRGLEDRLLEWLPAWALGGSDWRAGEPGRLMAALCETAGMAHRFELSPAARRALGVRGGATPAHLREQLAFLDGDPPGTIKRTWQKAGRGIETQGPAPPRSFVPGPRKGNARSQYLKLCAIFPRSANETSLPLTGEVIDSGNAASPESRRKVLAEIRALFEQDSPEQRLQPIVQILAGWVEDMILNGTPSEGEPALSTVETYLTRVGKSLVHIFGQSSLQEVSEAELEDAYLATVGAQRKSKSKTAAAVLLFHEFGKSHFGLPEVDESGVRLFLREASEGLANADLILPAERTAILARLRTGAVEATEAIRGDEGRLRRQASQAMSLIALGGARRSEPLGLQFRDISIEDDVLRARIRPNHSRRLKTVNARRVFEIPLRTTLVDGAHLADWLGIERLRLKQRHLETAFIFSEVGAPFGAKARNAIVEVCLQVCREVTGRRLSRLHSFRHLVGMERTTPVFLSEADLKFLSSTVPLVPSPTQCGQLALPRDLQGQIVIIGHGDPATTLIWYHHLPWLLRSRAEGRISSVYLKRGMAASLLGVSRATLDWAVRQRPDRPHPLAWLDVQCDPRVVPVGPLSVEPVSAEVECVVPVRPYVGGRWAARWLGDLLKEVGRVGSLEETLLVRGMPLSDADAIRLGLAPMEHRLGRCMYDERARVTMFPRPRRRLRRIESGDVFETLWDWFDSGHEQRRGSLVRLAEAVHEFMTPAQSDRISLPTADAHELIRLITLLGIQPEQIQQEPSTGALVTLRILRSNSRQGSNNGSDKAERYLGQLLKAALLVIRFVDRQG